MALSAAVADLQSKAAIEPASSEPGFYNRLFVTLKVTGGWWLVIDLSRLNRFVRLSPFHMETAQSVLQSLRPGDWMVSLALQDAYLQVPIHPDSRRYLRFCIGPHTFQFRSLCFGLSSAPQVFTRVMAPISSIMHRHGFRILRYLDDWLVLGSFREEIVQARDFLLSLCKHLGVFVNLSKSSLQPTQSIDHLGMSLHTSPLRAFPTQARIQKVLSLISEFTSSPAPPLLLWQSLLGVMSSLTPLIPGARLRTRSLQLCLRVAGPQTSDMAQISWDDSCCRDLLWWSDASHLVGGVPLELPHSRLLFTDASDTGWGAALGSDHLSGLWTQEISLFSINHRELLAILYAIHGFLHLLRGQSVSLFTDDASALAYLLKQRGTSSATLNSVAQAILRLCETNNVLLLPQFVLGKLNVLADSQVLGSEWTLCQEVCRDLFRCWSANIDLFATSMNHRLPAYFSPVVDPQALATDAMTQCWDGLQAYAFPPFGFILNVLAKVRQSRNLEVTLVAPYWPLKLWFPDVLKLLVDIPVLLPLRRDLLRQPHFYHFHQNLPALHMTGFRIASERRVISASLRRWLDNLPSAAGLPPM